MNSQEKKYSLKILISFAQGSLIYNLIDTAVFSQVQFYFENEILLNIWLYSLAFLIYTIYNMFNDPIAGYLCDRSTRFTKRWGKRFPWIIIFAFPYCLVPLLIFSSPTVSQVGETVVFIWLLVSLCLLDTFLSIYQINYTSLLPDKFRDDKTRNKVGSINSIFITIGIALGFILPPLIAEYGKLESYQLLAIVLAIMGLISAVAFIPGVREDKEMRERRAVLDAKERTSFLKTLIFALKEKNFVMIVLVTLFFQIYLLLLQANIPYWNSWMLGLSKDYELYPLLAYMLVAVAVVPLWYKLGNKYGALKMFTLGAFMTAFAVIPLLFLTDIVWTIIVFGIGGIGMGGTQVLGIVLLGDVIDELTIKSGKREEGIYLGVRVFIIRLAFIVQAFLFAIVHTATGYVGGVPGEVVQTADALFGIRMLMSLIPMVMLLIGTLLFWKIYDITPEKAKINKEKLIELNL